MENTFLKPPGAASSTMTEKWYRLSLRCIFYEIFHKVTVSLSVEQLSWFQPWVTMLKITNIARALLNGPFKLDVFYLELRFPSPSNSGLYLQTQKEKGQTSCCIQSRSCGQGKRRAERMPVGFAMESEWTKKLSQAFSFFGQPAAMALFFFFFLCGASIRMDGRRRRRRRRSRRRRREPVCEGKNCDGNSPRAHCHSLEVLIPNRFKLFLGHFKEYTGKEHVLRNRFFFFFFYKISFTLIADLVCYATCDIVIVSLTGLQSEVVGTLLC